MTLNPSWHADEELLKAYVAGRLSRARAASVETHLVSCAACRSAIAPIVEPQRLERNLVAIVDRVARPSRNLFERLFEKVGIPEHIVRALAVTPSDRAPWMAGIAVAILVAVGADVVSTSDATMFALLVAAPLLPLAGVSAGVRLATDPLGELVATTPTTRFRLLMLRSMAVLVPAVVLSATVSVAAPERGWEPVLWLLPALGLSALALALGMWVSIRPVAWAIGGGWVAAAAIAAHGAPRTEVVSSYVAFRPPGQFALLAVGLLAGAVVMVRRDSLDFIELGRMS